MSVAPLGDHQSTSGFRCVPSAAQTSRDLPFMPSFSTASVSFMTLGFHTALRAVKACCGWCSSPFNLLLLCRFLSSIYTAFHPQPLHFFPKLHFIFCAAGSRRDCQLLCLWLCNGGNGEEREARPESRCACGREEV